jgi:hypothetical protein
MAETLLPVVYVMLLLGTILLSYAVYGRYYIKSDTKLMFSLDDPVCFNPEFHHQFLKQQMAKLPRRVPATIRRPWCSSSSLNWLTVR